MPDVSEVVEGTSGILVDLIRADGSARRARSWSNADIGCNCGSIK